jgi:hypothetical protein
MRGKSIRPGLRLLEREVNELRRANENLRQPFAYFTITALDRRDR